MYQKPGFQLKKVVQMGLLLLGMCILTAPSAAQWTETPALGRAHHIIIPQSRSFTLERHRVGVAIALVNAHIRIIEQTATTTLQIELVNHSSQPEEAIVLLPVPDQAVVSAFAFDGSAPEPTAEVLTAEEARRLYDEIVRRVRDPALLEFAGYQLIRSSVFPVPASGRQRVRITYEHLLSGDGDRVDYLLPRSESLQNSVPWKITADIQSRHPISTIYSPSHQLVTHRISTGHIKVELDSVSFNEPGPFRLSYLREGDGVNATLFAYPDPQVGGGYFLLMAGLPADVSKLATIRREITLVIDRSGSMAGEKFHQACTAAQEILANLREGESFNIIDYSTTVSSFASQPVTKTPYSAQQAAIYLQSIRPSGGTNIHDALLEALRAKPTAGTVPLVLFLTDGLPTVGRTNERIIREMAEAANTYNRRIFTLGVGEDVNAPLLDYLSEASRGISDYVLPGDTVDHKIAALFKRLQGPVLVDAELKGRDATGRINLIRQVLPDPLPDMFIGDQLIVLGQYWNDQPITFELSGNYLGRPRTFTFTFDLDQATTRNAFVPRLWASRRITELIDHIRQVGAPTTGSTVPLDFDPFTDPRLREMAEEVLRLSTEFGILTEYTAFLAREGTDLSNWRNAQTELHRSLNQRAVHSRSGQGAINQARNYARGKGQTVLNHRNSYFDEQMQSVQYANVQQLGNRAFFQNGQRWTDSKLVGTDRTPQPDVIVTFGSERYRQLLDRLIGQGEQAVMSLSGEIVLQLDGQIILIRNSETP